VIGRESGVGERGDVGRLQRLVDLHHAARRCLQIVGVAAVGVDAGEGAGLAVHVVAGAAGPAQPAGDQRMHDHLVTLPDVGDRGADRLDPAGVLVADGVRQLDLRLLGPLPFQDVQVGATHTGAADLDHHIERSGRGRCRYLLHLEVLVVADDLDGSHCAHGVMFLSARIQTGRFTAESGTNAPASG
jgi:hypothetical protein